MAGCNDNEDEKLAECSSSFSSPWGVSTRNRVQEQQLLQEIYYAHVTNCVYVCVCVRYCVLYLCIPNRIDDKKTTALQAFCIVYRYVRDVLHNV